MLLRWCPGARLFGSELPSLTAAETMPQEAQPAASADEVAVVMVPLPAQGHLNQLLHLSRLLARRRGISVHYLCSATHNRQARDRSPRVDEDRLIRFHDVPVSITSCPPPDPRASNKFPDHLLPAFHAAVDLRAPLAELCRALATAARRVVVVFDSSLPLAAEVAASVDGAEAYCFQPISAIDTLCFVWARRDKPSAEALEELKVPYISTVLSEAFWNFYFGQLQSNDGVISGCLLNTCHALEARFIQMLKQVPEWPAENTTFAIGPLNMAVASRGPRHECLEWLDEQPPESVAYVSFGTTMELTDEQVAELARGLEDSGHRFVWLLKDADRADIYAAAAAAAEGGPVAQTQTQSDKLPPGFCKRNEGVGKVVRSWAPQPDILAHPSTAAFMSHCGWNSCMESFSAGVPILAWPMHSDQPMNALLATHVLGVGLPVCEWGKPEEVVPAAAISGAITKLMESEEGREVRRKARELGSEVRSAMEEGGSSAKDMDAFVALITR